MFKKGQARPEGAGRKKGTPNKRTVFGQQQIADLLSDYNESGLMASDFAHLEPKDRLIVAEKFTSYIVPKRQAIDGVFDINSASKTIEETLRILAQDND